MNLKEIVEGLQQEFSDFTFSDETRYNLPAYWWNLIAEKRAIVIRERFHRNKKINPSVYQNMGIIKAAKVDFDEDLGGGCKREMGKVKIPQLVHIEDNMMHDNDLGMKNLMSTCGTVRYDPTNQDMFYELMALGGHRSRQPLFFRMGDMVYFAPYRPEIKLWLILSNPLDGFFVREYDVPLDQLILNEVYKVVEGNIKYFNVSGELTTINKGETFTADPFILNATGDGRIRFNVSKIDLRITDEYPMTYDMMEPIKKMIREDLNNGRIFGGDINNDSTDERHLQQSS